MFSKEWFIYVFGRWVVVSGIAGAIVQYFFADMLHIHTIPAFLLNQFCLACVFWYVDRLIFKRHFKENLLEFFRFPRIRHAFSLKDQCTMLTREFSDFRNAVSGNEENPQQWLHAFVDLVHAVEMTELLLREHSINIDAEIERVREENRKKGLYEQDPAKPKPHRTRQCQSDFLTAISQKTIIADGAMGTYLLHKLGNKETCLEYLNCINPDLVYSVHAEYCAAGAHLIETNTFGANRIKLARYGLAEKAAEINREGARIARKAAGSTVFVAGSVGPLGCLLSPYGTLSLADAHAAFREQIEALAEGGVDLIIIETMTSLLEAREAVLVCRQICDLPIVCQMSFTHEGFTLQGDPLGDSLVQLRSLGAAVVGMNCTIGPQEMLDLVQQIPADLQGILAVQPNAGLPAHKNGAITYPSSPEYFALYAPQFQQYGACLIGGCCGTTPDHIRAIAGALQQRPPAAQPRKKHSEPPSVALPAEPQKTTIPLYVEQQPFITVEVSPPKTIHFQEILNHIQAYKNAGADAINVTENPMARMHMSSLAFCALIKRQSDIKIFLHVTTRDKNLLALQSDLLGAAALGVDGVVALKGDPASIGDIPYATSVFDVSTTGLIKIIRDMNNGKLVQSMFQTDPTRFIIAAGANPNTDNLSAEIDRLKQKKDAGAHCVFTQPVYDRAVLERFMNAIAPLAVPVIVGLLPLKNRRQVEYLHNEVPGIIIPESIRRDLQPYDGNEGIRKGIDIAVAFINAVAPDVAGFYLMPPRNYVEETVFLIHHIRSLSSRRELS